jgi:hypothetical protein
MLPQVFAKAANVLVLAGLVFRPAVAHGHHEAIFGPQSASVFSADRFVSVQVFDRALGTSESRTHETTAAVSAGLPLSRRYPITLTAILPYSWISQHGRSLITGAEDVVLGLRYRFDLKGLQDRWDREGNFVIGMGAVELNNGVIDHSAWSGPMDAMGAVLGSIERGRWSAIGYTVARFNAADEGNKDGNNVILGAGAAFTPNEDFASGRLISYQVAASFEHYSRDQLDGQPEPRSGGDELLVHPTVTYSPGHDLLFFGMASLPIWRDFRDPAAQDAYRLGFGTVYSW